MHYNALVSSHCDPAPEIEHVRLCVIILRLLRHIWQSFNHGGLHCFGPPVGQQIEQPAFRFIVR